MSALRKDLTILIVDDEIDIRETIAFGFKRLRKDDLVGFKMEVSGSPLAIEGKGIVKWDRGFSVGDEPPGCGIEFLYLDPSVREKMIELIQKTKPIAYIPKGPRKLEPSVDDQNISRGRHNL